MIITENKKQVITFESQGCLSQFSPMCISFIRTSNVSIRTSEYVSNDVHDYNTYTQIILTHKYIQQGLYRYKRILWFIARKDTQYKWITHSFYYTQEMEL